MEQCVPVCVCVRYGNATQRVIASGTNIDLKRQKVRMAADIAANIKRFSMLFIPDVSKSSCLRAHNIAKPHTPLKTTCCCWWCGSSCCLPSWPLLQCSVVDAGKNFNLKQGKWSPMAAHASLSLSVEYVSRVQLKVRNCTQSKANTCPNPDGTGCL